MPRSVPKIGYDPLDRVTSGTSSASAMLWTYDANGNRQAQGGAAAPAYATSSLTFGYNNRGRMASATSAGSTNYIYNALGQRISKSGSGGTTLFAYDEAGHLLGEYTAAGALVQETIWMGDLPMATIRPGSPVLVYYVHADHLGTPRAVTRSSDNAKVWRWDSDPFGVAPANSNPGGLGVFVYNLRYPEQYYDSETGLSYNYFRDLDPQTGRYVESDPIGLDGGQASTYSHAANSPSVYSDPLSLCKIDVRFKPFIRGEYHAYKIHPRSRHRNGQRIKIDAHFPPASQAYYEATPQKLLSQSRFVHQELNRLFVELFNTDVFGNLRRCQGLVRRRTKEINEAGREVACARIVAAIASMRRYNKIRVPYVEALLTQARKRAAQTDAGRQIVRRPGNPMIRYLGGAALSATETTPIPSTPAQETLKL